MVNQSGLLDALFRVTRASRWALHNLQLVPQPDDRSQLSVSPVHYHQKTTRLDLQLTVLMQNNEKIYLQGVKDKRLFQA
jgi:hypothetical protein